MAARARTAADAAVERLTHLTTAPQANAPTHSLSAGAAGVALLHIERARSGTGPWPTAHTWLGEATRAVATGPKDSLFRGVPAVAFAVGTADGQGRYTRALETLDDRLADLTRKRLTAAHARIDRGARPTLSEFDLVNGLTGLGAALRRRDPHGLLGAVLDYLVRLSEPVDRLPGWWTDQAPTGRRARPAPGGYSDQGIAHGIAGPLALLALSLRSGVTVTGQAAAIERICGWLDKWQQPHAAGPWWPEILTREDLRRGRPAQTGPGRPSWCYGTVGLARAAQLAGLATGDAARQRAAEHALAGCLSDPRQRARLSDHGLCHGTAGVLQTAWRSSADACSRALEDPVRTLTEALCAAGPDHAEPAGFLRGAAGRALALSTAATGLPPSGGWDACLLLN